MVRVKAVPKRIVPIIAAPSKSNGPKEDVIADATLVTKGKRELREVTYIGCRDRPEDEKWLHMSTWPLVTVENISKCEICLFLQDNCLKCLLTNTFDQTQVLATSFMSQALFNDVKSSIKSNKITFQFGLQNNSRDQQCLALLIYVRKYSAVQQPQHSTTEPLDLLATTTPYYYFSSKRLVEWMLGYQFAGDELKLDGGSPTCGFSLPSFLRQVSDRSIAFPSLSGDEKQLQHLKQEEKEAYIKEKLRIRGLLPTLRPYQLQAVLWMMQREGGQEGSHIANEKLISRVTPAAYGFIQLPSSDQRQSYRAASMTDVESTVSSPLWELASSQEYTTEIVGIEQHVKGHLLRDVESCGGRSASDVWYNVLTESGCVFNDPHEMSSSRSDKELQTEEFLSKQCPSLVSGGMLCDEPGLGKTLEVLGLILMDKEKGNTTTGESGNYSGDGSGLPNHSTSESRSDKTVPASRQSGGEAVACVCMKTSYRPKLHLGWVQCDVCDRYCHITCAGFSSVQDAQECSHYECQVCACCRLSANPLPAQSTTLIVVPFNLIGQWCREIDKHVIGGGLTYTVYDGYKFLQQTGGTRTNCRKRGPKREIDNVIFSEQEKDKGHAMAGATLPMRVAAMHPESLTHCDIVLTSFETIAAELARTNSPYSNTQTDCTAKMFDPIDVTPRGLNTKSLRHEKKYRVSPSPLACVHWHRVCLDEAQLVEGTATAAAQMASKLLTRHRWCVSGTPVGKGRLQDLQGLFAFLRQDPVGDTVGWRELIERPIQRGDPMGMSRLSSLCDQLLLRRTKRGVDEKGQLRLPKQREIVKHLTLSAVESHFYQQQFKESSQFIRKFMTKTSLETRSGDETSKTTSDHVSKSIASDAGTGLHHCPSDQNEKDTESLATDHLSDTLLILRQAACHPQLGSRGIGSRGNSRGSKKGRHVLGTQTTHKGMQVLTMDQILFKLIDEAKLKCEEHQRVLLMHMAASAGIFRVQAEGLSLRESAKLHFISKARGVYADALQCYSDNRGACLVLGTMTVSSVPGLEFYPLCLCDDPLNVSTQLGTPAGLDAQHQEKENALVSYNRRAHELSMCWRGEGRPVSNPRDPIADCITVSQLLSLSSDMHGNATTLGCQLDNSSSSTASSSRRILQMNYRFDIELAVMALLSGRGGAYSPCQSLISTCEDLTDGFYEHIGMIYFPSDVSYQSAVNGAVYMTSHRFKTAAPTKSREYKEVRESGPFNLNCSNRSKSWRILINSVHCEGLAVFLCTPREDEQDKSSCVRVIPHQGRSVGCESSIAEKCPNWAVALSCSLHEAEFDIDLLQEIHLTSNYGDLLNSNCKSIADEITPELREPSVLEAVTDEFLDPYSTPSRHVTYPELLSRQSPYRRESSREMGMKLNFGNDNDQQVTPSFVTGRGKIHPQSRLSAKLTERSTLLSDQYTAAAQLIRNTGKNKAAELVQHTDILYASFRDTGGWEWMHVLMYLASASTPSLNSCFLEGELLEGVQRMVDGNEQAYACLTPHLQSCASLGGAFVDAVKELESCREKAVRGLLGLPYTPTGADIEENSNCKKCRQDWGKMGRVCRHCKLEGMVSEYQKRVFAYRKHTKKSREAAQSFVINMEEGTEESCSDFFEMEGLVTRLAKIMHRFLRKNAKQLQQHLNAFSQLNSTSVNLQNGKGNDSTHTSVEEMQISSDKCLAYLEALEREVSPLKSLWRQHFHCFSVMDELQTAKVPLKLIRHDVAPDNLQGFVPEGEEIALQEEHSCHIVTSQEELNGSIGQLHYLKNMAFGRLSIGCDSTGGVEREGRTCASLVSTGGARHVLQGQKASLTEEGTKEDCAVCMECLIDGDVCVLSCGHEFHKDCVYWILNRLVRSNINTGSAKRKRTAGGNDKSLRCPVCREITSEENILQVSHHSKIQDSSVSQPQSSHADITSKGINPPSRDSKVRVKGDWGTKITAVVGDILGLKCSTPHDSILSVGSPGSAAVPTTIQKHDVKSIVFSQWDQMLDICAAALQLNGIEHEKFGGQGNSSKRHFEMSLARFQNDPFVSVLLLPLKSGAQGLTLVEATHVFFLEPMLNLEQEAQAVNRIHRIGQEHETFVHKYVTQNTVEDKIHRMYEDRVRKEVELQEELDHRLQDEDRSSIKEVQLSAENITIEGTSGSARTTRRSKKQRGDQSSLSTADMTSFFM